MPYIKQAARAQFEEPLKLLMEKLDNTVQEDVDGCLNYVITRLLHHVYPIKYFYLNRAIGVLECAKLEYYRAVAAPYEDIKRKENGEV